MKHGARKTNKELQNDFITIKADINNIYNSDSLNNDEKRKEFIKFINLILKDLCKTDLRVYFNFNLSGFMKVLNISKCMVEFINNMQKINAYIEDNKNGKQYATVGICTTADIKELKNDVELFGDIDDIFLSNYIANNKYPICNDLYIYLHDAF